MRQGKLFDTRKNLGEHISLFYVTALDLKIVRSDRPLIFLTIRRRYNDKDYQNVAQDVDIQSIDQG